MAEKNPSSRSYAPQGGLSAAMNRDVLPVAAPTTGTWGEAISRFTPILSDVWGIKDAKDQYQAGNTGQAAVTGGLSALGMGGLGKVMGAGIFVGNRGAIESAIAGNRGIFDSQKLAKIMRNKEAGGREQYMALDPMARKELDKRIWAETGSVTGYPSSVNFPDGHVQTEIDDSLAKFNRFPAGAQMGKDINDMRGTTEQFLPHPELYKAYPQIGKETTNIMPAELMGEDIIAQRSRDANFLNSKHLKSSEFDPKGSLLHEMQHGIDRHEGMGTGASVEYMQKILDTVKPVAKQYHDILTSMREAGVKYTDKAYKKVEQALRMEVEPHFRKVGSWEADSAYTRTAGETKARLVDARRNLNMEERKRIYPLDYDFQLKRPEDKPYVADVPDLLQMVRQGQQELVNKSQASPHFPGSEMTRMTDGTYRHYEDVDHSKVGFDDEPSQWAEGGYVHGLVNSLSADDMESLLVALHGDEKPKFANGGLVLDGAKGMLGGNGLNLINPSNNGSAPLDIPMNSNNMMAKNRAGTPQGQLYRTR